MMIKKITLENFRRHKNVTVNFEDRLTLIVGENDCGKSSLLRAIRIGVVAVPT